MAYSSWLIAQSSLMTNKQIATALQDLASIMELHGENIFKIRSYQNAYIVLRKLDKPLSAMLRSEMDALKGVGKAIGDKIEELLKTGELQTYKKYTDITPPGVIEMLNINGFGPKKVLTVWKELGVENLGELLYACNENRLIEIRGFGKKTQDELIKNIQYYLRNADSQLWANAEKETQEVIEKIKEFLPDVRIEVVGEMRRKLPTVRKIELVMVGNFAFEKLAKTLNAHVEIINLEKESDAYAILSSHKLAIEHSSTDSYQPNLPLHIFKSTADDIAKNIFLQTGSEDYLKDAALNFKNETKQKFESEQAVFAFLKKTYIEPELRENANLQYTEKENAELVTVGSIKGIIHTHTTFSDGVNTLAEMAHAAQHLGYQYIGITDHSQAAFYANGLKEERVLQQWAEIDTLNASMFNFKILKGIESDILYDGSLDYPEELLAGFDFVIASVHSTLKMNEEKATTRLITAIENKYTTILGHPTGRLLLSRAGYPIDHKKIIDACAANKVTIELNANPYRLDLDWTWIDYARKKGVLIAINPDAHSIAGINDIRYGVNIARKGGLQISECLNTLSVEDFLNFAEKR